MNVNAREMVQMARESGSASKKKKSTQGRKKIDIKKIENMSNRQVTFSKRRVGLFKKAAELCILTGAEIAIVVHSLGGKRIFTFAHPDPDTVINRFLNGGEEGDGAVVPVTQLRNAEYNRRYSEVCKELDAEKKIDEAMKAEEGGGGGDDFWWNKDVEGMEVGELEEFANALEELTKTVHGRATDMLNARVYGGGVGLDMQIPNTAAFDFGNYYIDNPHQVFGNEGQY